MAVEQEAPGETSPAGHLPSRLEVHAYTAPARLVAAALQALAALNILYIAANIVHDIVEGEQTAPPLIIALGLALFSGVPAITVALLRRLFTATVELQPPLLMLALRRAQFEIPLSSIKAIRPLKLPLPYPGIALEMTSGRRFRYRLQLADPSALLAAIGEELPSAQAALRHPSIVHASARYLLARRGWVYRVIKFVLFPLVLTVILFRLDQYIVYGGLFGQYYLFGLAAYLKSFGSFWAGTTGGLVVYAGTFRLAAEALALPLTWAAPSRARLVRRAVEIFCLLAYFGAVPAYVLARLLL
jgi:hypothetical protein